MSTRWLNILAAVSKFCGWPRWKNLTNDQKKIFIKTPINDFYHLSRINFVFTAIDLYEFIFFRILKATAVKKVIKTHLAFESMKYFVKHILQVRFGILPRGYGITKENKVIDNSRGINADHLGKINLIEKTFSVQNIRQFHSQ